MDTLTKQQVADLFNTSMANVAIEVLEETGRSSQVIWEGPRPLMPHRENGWELSEVKDEFTLPDEVVRRINILRYHDIPIKEILVAHELPPVKVVKELPAPKETPTVRPPDAPKTVEKEKKVSNLISSEDLWFFVQSVLIAGTILSLVVGAVIALAAFIVFLPVLAGLASAAIVPIVLIGGLLLGCGTDPIAIVVLDDGADTWLMVGMWYE